MAIREIRTETAGGGRTRVTVKHEYYETLQERDKRKAQEREMREKGYMETAMKTAAKPVIAGIEVSQETYNDYSKRSYNTQIGQLSYRTVELYATGSGIGQEAPEVAEECRAICMQIRNEVLQINAQETKKNITRHEKFTEYLGDLGQLYNDATSERKRMVTDHENAVQKLDQEIGAAAAASEGDADARLLRAKAARVDEFNKFKADMDAFQERVKLQILTIREGLQARISEFYEVSADRIDDNTTKLLNSGLKLTEHELNNLFVKFSNNTTMLRLIADYCELHDIDKQDAAIYGGRAKSNGSHEMGLFDGLAERLTLAVGFGSEVSEKVWSPENGHFDNVLNNSIRELENTLVKP